jgi:hypothetical protein
MPASQYLQHPCLYIYNGYYLLLSVQAGLICQGYIPKNVAQIEHKITTENCISPGVTGLKTSCIVYDYTTGGHMHQQSVHVLYIQYIYTSV